jgi:membrane fusion protein, multidrug efflux system
MNAITETPVVDSAPPKLSRDAAALGAKRAAPKVRRAALRAGAAVVVLAIAAGIGTWWITEGRYIESTDNAYLQSDIAVLSPRIEGDVVRIDVADNQRVKAGDPLIELDGTDAQLRLDQARAQAAEADAAIAVARQQVLQSDAMIAEADAQIAQAEAEATRATADLQRFAQLVGGGSVSRQTYDQAMADNRKAQAALANARAMRQASGAAQMVAQAQVTQAEARKATAESAVRLAERDLSYTVIRSPIDGIAGNRAAQLGAHVRPGAQVIAVAPLRDQVFVIANFKETQLRHVEPGQKVLLTPDIDSGAAIEGRVDSIAPATGALFSLLPPENATGNFTKVVQRVPVKIVVDRETAEKAKWLRAGLSVTADVDTRGPQAEQRGFIGSILHAVGLG